MYNILQLILPLIGVGIGGWISYLAQTKHQLKMEGRKDRRQKLMAYNNILSHEGDNSPLVYSIHHGTAKKFEWDTYKDDNRKNIYKSLHLFDQKIAYNILRIDEVGEICEYMGPEPEDIDEIFNLYEEIIKRIREDYIKQFN